MNTFWQTSTFFGIFITLFFYGVGMFLKQKVKHTLVNPLLIAIVFTILFLRVFGIEYQTYNNSAKYISYLMTPATICLAVPLYRQLDTLKRNFKAVMFGIASSVIVTMVSVLALSRFFGLSRAAYVTMLPKSITTPIGIGIAEELGGYVAITVASIVISGILGNMFAETVCKMHCQRDCHWLFQPCHGYRESVGDGGSGRRHEFAVHCAGRYSDRSGGFGVCHAAVGVLRQICFWLLIYA